MPSDYFEEGNKFFQAKQYTKALEAYRYIADHYKRNSLYPEAFYNMGYTYYVIKNDSSAVSIFKAILVSDFNEKELIGGDIMSSPFANFRHRAADLLSSIYYAQKKYDSSLYYLALSDTTYEYLHFCGNELDANEIYLSLRYADLYQKMGDTQKALNALLKKIFVSIEDNSEVLKTLKDIFKKQPKKDWKKEMASALQNMHPGTSVTENDKEYYITFLGTELRIPLGYEAQGFNKQVAIKKIKETAFYKMIIAL